METHNKDKKIFIHWDMTSNEIISATNELISKSLQINDQLIKSYIDSDEDIKSFLQKISDDISEFEIFHSMCGFLQYVSPNEKTRRASFVADLMLSKHGNELN